jgi:hypothetical protein
MTELPEGTHRIIDDPNRDDTRVVSTNAALLAGALEQAYRSGGPDAVRMQLASIRVRILDGTFPH